MMTRELAGALVCIGILCLPACGDDGGSGAGGAGNSSSSGGAGAGGDGDNPCEVYVDCATAVSPEIADTVASAYGPDGSCWTALSEDECHAACEEALADLAMAAPNEPACGGTAGSGGMGGGGAGGMSAGGAGGTSAGGAGGMSAGGMGGGGPCLSCGDFLSRIIIGGSPATEDLCADAAIIWNDVQTCICVSSCGSSGGPCQASCGGPTAPTAQCSMCGTTAISAGGECEAEGLACAED